MTILDQDRAWSRWLISLTIVLIVYVSICLIFLWQQKKPIPVPTEQPQAIMLELAPIVTTDSVQKIELPTGALQREQHKAVSKPLVSAPKQIVAVNEVVEKPDVVVPKKSKKVIDSSQQELEQQQEQVTQTETTPEKINKEKDKQEVKQTSAPPAQNESKPNQTNAAPQMLSGQSSQQIVSWQAKILARLEKFKRYPRTAQFNRQEGIATVRYTVNRQGQVLSATLAKTSGFKDLDLEAVEAVKRASPLPAPPDEIQGNPLTLTTPVNFFMPKK